VAAFPTRRRPADLVKDVGAAIARLLAQHEELGACVGVGVSLSGLVDCSGRLKLSPTLGWRDVDLVPALKAVTQLHVVVENSTKACVLGQVWSVRGDAPVDGPVAFVNVSDGVGVGIAVDGRLLRGAHNTAGEFGHVPLNMYGPRCACGQRGCLEAYASNRAIIARYRGTDPSWPASADTGSVTIEHVLERARAAEDRALETVRETGFFLSRGLATIIKAVDPRRIYVGGEITSVWDLVFPIVCDGLREDEVVRESGETEILTVALGEYPRLRGAAALIHSRAFAAPDVS
jgi:predicted NBD/HSP70 family sugar kinase